MPLSYHVSNMLTCPKKNPKASSFRNKGWPHFDAIKVIMLTSLAKGKHVFCSGQAVINLNSSDSSENADESRNDQTNDDGENLDISMLLLPATSPPPSILSPIKHKGSTLAIAPTNSSSPLSSCAGSTGVKRTRITGPIAMAGIRDELSNISGTLRLATESKIKLNEQRSAKIMDEDKMDTARNIFLAKESDLLGPEAIMMMIDLFESDDKKVK